MDRVAEPAERSEVAPCLTGPEANAERRQCYFAKGCVRLSRLRFSAQAAIQTRAWARLKGSVTLSRSSGMPSVTVSTMITGLPSWAIGSVRSRTIRRPEIEVSGAAAGHTQARQRLRWA